MASFVRAVALAILVGFAASCDSPAHADELIEDVGSARDKAGEVGAVRPVRSLGVYPHTQYQLVKKGSYTQVIGDASKNLCFLVDVQAIYRGGERCQITYDGHQWRMNAISGRDDFRCIAQCVSWPVHEVQVGPLFYSIDNHTMTMAVRSRIPATISVTTK